jgi:hypothetical protein
MAIPLFTLRGSPRWILEQGNYAMRLTGQAGIIIALIIVLSSQGWAQAPSEVVANGVVVMRFSAKKGMDYEKAAEAATKRIEEKINNGARPRDIKLVPQGKAMAIYWGDVQICLVDDYQAGMNKSTTIALARAWASNLMAAVSEHPLRLSKDTLSLPVGEEQRISVAGGGKGEIKATYEASIIDVTVNSEDGEIMIKGRAAGTARLILQKGSSKGALRVFVKDWAGKIAPLVEKYVTGNPVPQELLMQATLAAVGEGVSVLPGAQVLVKELPRIPSTLRPDNDLLVTVPLLIEGKGYYPLEGGLKVKLKNIKLPIAEPTVLMISNRPEELEEDGILFQGRLSPQNPARLLYSHKNSTSSKKRLWITLKNLHRKPLRLFVKKAYGGPDKFEIQVGHRAAMRYLDYLRTKAGYVVDIAPGATYVLDDYDLPPNYTLSGLCDLQILEGDEAEIEVKNVMQGKIGGVLKMLQEPFDPFKIHPHGIFPAPTIQIEKHYQIPGEPLTIEVGKWPWLIDSTTGEPNTGNYGVIYCINLKLTNKSNEQAKLDVQFTAINGVSMGSLIIDGTLYETGIVRQNETTRVAEITLAPREERNISIITFPEASSCYPVSIQISAGRRGMTD